LVLRTIGTLWLFSNATVLNLSVKRQRKTVDCRVEFFGYSGLENGDTY